MKNAIIKLACMLIITATVISMCVSAGAKVVDGWYCDSEGWYHVTNGEIDINAFIEDNGGICYVDYNGYLAYDYIAYDDNGWRFIDKTGFLATEKGWYPYQDDSWVYVGKDGYLVTDSWMKDSKGWCYLDYIGTIVKDDIVDDSRGRCLIGSNGYWITSKGWHKADSGNTWVYIGKDGYLVTDSWMKDSKGWCYLDDTGFMVCDEIVRDSKGLCYVNSTGYWVTKPGWNKAFGDSSWVYINNNGYLKSDCWVSDSKGWCHIDANGYLDALTIVADSKGLCYINGESRWDNKGPLLKKVSIYDYDLDDLKDVYIYVNIKGYLLTNQNKKVSMVEERDGSLVLVTEEWHFDENGYGSRVFS